MHIFILISFQVLALLRRGSLLLPGSSGALACGADHPAGHPSGCLVRKLLQSVGFASPDDVSIQAAIEAKDGLSPASKPSVTLLRARIEVLCIRISAQIAAGYALTLVEKNRDCQNLRLGDLRCRFCDLALGSGVWPALKYCNCGRTVRRLYFRHGNLACRRCTQAIYASQACDKAAQHYKHTEFKPFSKASRCYGIAPVNVYKHAPNFLTVRKLPAPSASLTKLSSHNSITKQAQVLFPDER